MVKTWESDLVERQDRANRYLAEKQHQRVEDDKRSLIVCFIFGYALVLVMVGLAIWRINHG